MCPLAPRVRLPRYRDAFQPGGGQQGAGELSGSRAAYSRHEADSSPRKIEPLSPTDHLVDLISGSFLAPDSSDDGRKTCLKSSAIAPILCAETQVTCAGPGDDSL